MCEVAGPAEGHERNAERGAARADSATAVTSRRGVLRGGIGLASFAGMGLVGAAPSARAAVGSLRTTARTRAILVGTAGGPIWRQAAGRRGICTVVEVAGARYLVDAGHGAASGLWGAGAVGPVDGK